MELADLPSLRTLCTRDEPVFCTNQCPLSVDVKSMAARVAAGDFTGAFQAYRERVLFPGIVSIICDEPCAGACIRKQLDEPVAIKLLEQACCSYAERKETPAYYIPPKNKLVAVIGGGLGGLGCALTLARKGYRVHVYEAKERLGGELLSAGGPLTAELLAREFDGITGSGDLTLFLQTRVESLDDVACDALYIATGKEGDRFGLEAGFDPVSLATAQRGVFMSGGAARRAEDPALISLREGIRVAQSIESYLKTGKMGGEAGKFQVIPSRLQVDLAGAESVNRVKPAGLEGYTAAEASQEAKRCLQCACHTCFDACELMGYFNKQPQKIIDDVIATFNVVVSLTTRVASRQINSCNLCGLCKEVCPVSLDFGSVFLASRRALHREGKLPPAFHDFWIRDMNFANSEKAFLVMAPTGKSEGEYMFFPGCQLGASDPRYVTAAYAYLAESLAGGVSIMVGCCGAPAAWAGREEEHRAVLAGINDNWVKQGKPAMILSCPTCKAMFEEYLPAIPVTSLWSIMAEKGLPASSQPEAGRVVSVFDSCASRYDPGARESVRAILRNSGYQLEELPFHGERAQCCGYGGHIHAVNPPLLDKIVANRVQGSPHCYVTYCTNCRDTFASVQKPAIHLLDLLTYGSAGEHRALRPPPTLTQRRENRIQLKRQLLNQWKGINMPPPEREYAEIKLYISPEVSQKMDRNLIVEEDARRTIHYCETSGYKLLDPSTGNYIGHHQNGVITYWVVYRPEGDGFRLVSIYSHRLVIEEEER